jgi:hypothetical protein
MIRNNEEAQACIVAKRCLRAIEASAPALAGKYLDFATVFFSGLAWIHQKHSHMVRMMA